MSSVSVKLRAPWEFMLSVWKAWDTRVNLFGPGGAPISAHRLSPQQYYYTALQPLAYQTVVPSYAPLSPAAAEEAAAAAAEEVTAATTPAYSQAAEKAATQAVASLNLVESSASD